MKNFVRFFALLIGFLFVSSSGASQIVMQFDVQMNWRYDLASSSLDNSFSRPAFSLTATFDDGITQVTQSGLTTNIRFGSAAIMSPLSTLVNLGIDSSTLVASANSYASLQDTFISPSNQGAWMLISESLSSSDGSLGRWLQFTDNPRLSDPLAFGSSDLFSLLQSNIGHTYGYREDSSFIGGGFQHNGSAVLREVSIASSVPEPSSVMLLCAGAIVIVGLSRRRSQQMTPNPSFQRTASGGR